MIRCYMGTDKVVGFGHQFIKALIPPPPEGPDSPAAQPGPRIMHGPDAAPFQALRAKMENEWTQQMMQVLGIDRRSLPIIWDGDFLYGPQTASGEDSYVLCEINVSSSGAGGYSAFDPGPTVQRTASKTMSGFAGRVPRDASRGMGLAVLRMTALPVRCPSRSSRPMARLATTCCQCRSNRAALTGRLQRSRGRSAERRLMARKRPTVAPAEGLLTEAVLTMSALCRTAAHDPTRTLASVLCSVQ
jgi:hypothetical protein